MSWFLPPGGLRNPAASEGQDTGRSTASLGQDTIPSDANGQAISVIEAIAAKTEDRIMYDQRLKAQRDYQWGLDSARQEGMEKGMEKGRQEGLEKGEVVGKIQLLQDLLGVESSATASLRERTIDELSTMLTDLQQRLRSRKS
ncbi:MAG: hypothetical protein KJ000_20840 [Pirellulaceae bacterium]|nr:hypothetical protein [Pirellulaceae bacterium]